MATDSTNLSQGEMRPDVASDMAAGDLDPMAVQVAEAPGALPGAQPVELPGGSQVVTIPVQPGQTIEIPTDGTSGVLAKIGPEGNLAIVVDGRTIILQGYLTANEEAPVKVVTDDGDSVDVAELIAATDPALDIQTAAGPAAGAQTGTDGSGIYIPFGPAGGLGGLNAVGVLGATALQYRLIDNETKLFDRDEEDGSPQGIQIVPDEGRPVLGDQSFVLDEDDLATGTAGGPGDDPGTTTSSGTVVVDFGSDGPRDADPIVMSGIVNGSESGLFALNPNSTAQGAPILLQLDAPAGGVQVLHGYVGGVEYFTVTLNTATGHFVIEQLQPLWHPDAGTEDNVPLNIQFTAFDANGDSLSAILKLSFDDDSPVATDDTDTVQEGSGGGEGEGGNVATGNVVTGGDSALLGKDSNSTDGTADAPGADKHYTISKLAHDGHTYTLSADGTTVLKDGAPLAAPDSFDGSKLTITTAEGATFEIVMKSANQSEVGEYRYTVGENPSHAEDVVVGPADIAATRSDAFDTAGEWQSAFTAGGINLTATGGSLAIKNVDVDPKSGFGGAEDYRGVGVDTGIDGAEVDTQGESLTLEFDPAKFPGGVNNAAVLIGALFDGVQFDNGKQEILKWEAYDGDTLIASGIIVGDHDGLVTLDIDTATNFNKVVLTSLSNGAGNTGNNSDFLLVNVEVCQQKDVKEAFDYTLRDGDGDESTATLTIGVEDTQPTVPGEGSGPLCLTVDEDGLPNGIGDSAPNDDAGTNSNVATGNIPFAPGADPVTIELNVGNGGDTGLKTLSGKTVLAAWDAATSTLIGYVAGTDPSDAANQVFKMTVTDHNTGAVTFELLQPVKHADGQQDDNTENNPDPSFTVNVQIEDADCDVAHTTVKVKIDDDMPVVQIAATASGTVQHDETKGVDSGSGDDDRSGSVPSLFNNAGLPPVGSAIGWARDGDPVVQLVDARYGADGPGSTSYALKIPAAGMPSGVSTTDGKAIWLYEGPNGTIVGRVGDGVDGATANPNGAVAFAVSIDGGGALTLVQYLSLHHPTPGSSHDETISLDAGALKAVVTLTDADGDSASDEAEIGNLVRFDDDGPKARIETVHNKLVQHDETAGVQNPGSGNDMDQSGPLPAKFAGIVGTLIGWAKSNGAVVDTSDSAFGQDDEGATKVLSLAVKADGVDSGIDDTATGKNILLYVQDGLVVGKLEGTDIVAFAMALNQDGTIEVAQYRALEHPNQSDHDESISIADGIRIDDSALQAVVTVTDDDGDTDVDKVDIGSKVQFDDDGPSVCLTKKDGAEIRLDESVGPSTPADGNGNDNDEAGNVSGDIGYAKAAGSDLFTKAVDYGQDGPAGSGSAIYALVLNDDDSGLFDTKTGSEVQLSTSSGSIVGRVFESGSWKTVFTISVDPNSGEVTVVQYRAVKHGDPSDHDEADTSEIMDQNTVYLKLTVKDGDGDTASDTIDLGKLIKFEDDGPVAVADVDSVTEDGPMTAVGNVLTGANSTSYGSDSNNTDGAADDGGSDIPATVTKVTNYLNVSVTPDSNGEAIAGQYGTLYLQSDGDYKYELSNGLPSVQGLGDTESLTETFTYTMKDGDGDSSSTTLTITIKGADDPVLITDLTPQAQGGDAAVYEKGLPTRNGGEPAGTGEAADGNQADDDDPSEATTGTFKIQAGDGIDEVYVHGTKVIDNNALLPGIVITTPEGNALTVTGYNAMTGVVSYSYVLKDNETHGGDGTNLFDSVQVKLVDEDGDQASGTLSIKIVDDVPTAKADVDSITEGDVAPATGNVISGIDPGPDANADDGIADVPGADGLASITWTDVVDAAQDYVQGLYGKLFVDGSGNYSYVLDNSNGDVTDLKNGDTLQEVFNYTITDGDGDPSGTSLTITIHGKDSPVTITDLTPQAQGGDAVVDEEALSDGTNPASTAEFGFGSFKISAPDGVDDLKISDGDNTITIINNGVFVGGTIGSSDLGNQLEITGYNAATGEVSYKYTLKDNENHPSGNGQNSLFDNFTVTLTDVNGDSATDTLSVKIIDDVPVANSLSKDVTSNLTDTNLMLVLDVSGSMDDDSGLEGLNKLELAIAAMKELIEQYDAKGNVMVQIVTFTTNATIQPDGVWLAVDQARAFLDNLSPQSATNYDDALLKAMDAFDNNGKLPGAQNVAYFLSDGMPTAATDWPGGGNVVDNGINASEQAVWEQFLKNNNINSFALGFGAPGEVTPGNLNPIDYNGVTGSDTRSAPVITDLNQLQQTLVATVNANVTGNLKTDNGNNVGADNPGIVSQVTFNGTQFNFDGTTITRTGTAISFTAVGSVLKFSTANATFEINMQTGVYTYALLGGAVPGPETFGYTLRDTDGDTASSTLSITVNAADVPPIVRDDIVFSNVNGDGASFVVPTAAFLWNDTDANDHPITFGSVSGIVDLAAVTKSLGNLTITDNNDEDGGTFTYSASANGKTDTGHVIVDRSQDNEGTLDGNGLDNILVGRDGSDDSLKGYEGDDVLLGHGGKDTLEGGAGRDWLIGGTGNDSLAGGSGNDLIEGGSGNDKLDGGAGDDALVGGAGNDTYDLDNESGDNDTIYITSNLDGNDVVNNFGDGENNGEAGSQDFIDLDQLFDSLNVATSDRAGRVQIADVGSNATVTVDLTGNGFDGSDIVITLNGIANIANLTKGNGATDDIHLGTM
jgi:VCBS repeat-containing protein